MSGTWPGLENAPCVPSSQLLLAPDVSEMKAWENGPQQPPFGGPWSPVLTAHTT